MLPETAQQLTDWFDDYVRGFARAGELHPMLQLKRDHSRRVSDDAAMLAARLPGMDVLIAGVSGLYHDVGRFSQFTEFGTFRDVDSINHGKRGREVLRDNQCLSCCDPAVAACIEDSVSYHNCWSMPAALCAPSMSYLKLIRDCDKIDISKIILDGMANGHLDKHPEILWHLTLNGAPNARIIESLFNHRIADARDVKCLADHLLMQLTWVFDMNYGASCALLRERNIMERIAGLLHRTPRVSEALEIAMAERDRRIRSPDAIAEYSLSCGGCAPGRSAAAHLSQAPLDRPDFS